MNRRELIEAPGEARPRPPARPARCSISAQTRALAADFDWQAHKGKTLKLLLNKHPYADAMIANLDNFKQLTGMDVTYDIFPEDVYFDKVTAALSSGSTEYDAFMTGAYMTWTYGPAGWIADLNEYIKDPAKTNPNYDWDDVLPGLRASTRLERRAGRRARLGRRQAVVHPVGLSSSTTSPTTRRCSTRPASSRRRTWTRWSTTAAKLTKDLGGGPTASACAARAPGRRSIRASCRATPTSARRTSTSADGKL